MRLVLIVNERAIKRPEVDSSAASGQRPKGSLSVPPQAPKRPPPAPPRPAAPPPLTRVERDAPTVPGVDPLSQLACRTSLIEVDCPSLPLKAGVVVGEKYSLTGPVGVGGMGAVWAATHMALETPVAIKFMTSSGVVSSGSGEARKAEDAGLSRKRFEREAKAAAQLRMANVVQVLDYGVESTIPYLVMELLEGEDLGARLKRVGRLTPAQTAKILVPVAHALQRAHESGLIHRDLKPANIFLAREGDVEIPKILDFGLVRPLRGHDSEVGDATTEGTVVGTAHYASPEQALGRTDIDHRSDLWSLSVVAFRCVTGVLPFHAATLLETVVEICSNPVPRIRDLAPELPLEVDAFFERALHREPAGRFQSARELADALETFAQLPSVAASAGGRKRRPWLWFGAGGLVVGAGVLWSLLPAPDTSSATSEAPPSGVPEPQHSTPPAVAADVPAAQPAVTAAAAPTAASSEVVTSGAAHNELAASTDTKAATDDEAAPKPVASKKPAIKRRPVRAKKVVEKPAPAPSSRRRELGY